MSILCATDLSASSRFTCRSAAALAKKTQQRLVLLHVMSGAATVAPVTTVDALRAIADELRSRGVDVAERVESGEPAVAIVRVAEEINARLIVIAPSTDALGGHFGGTADQVLSRTVVPVLVIRDGFPAEPWVAGDRSLRVAVAVDLSPISDNAALWASRLNEYGPIDLAVLHVEWPREAYERVAIASPMLLDQTHPAVEKLIRREIESAKQQMAGEGGREVAVMTESSSTDPAKAIVRMAASWNADLLVTGNRRARAWRVWEKSVSRAIVRAAPISVAGVPDADVPVPVEPNPMQRIIAATDLSPHGNAAVACALSLAPPDSSVVIVHVFDQEHVPEEERRRVMEGLSGMVVRRDLLERRVAARVELITSDDPARAILDLADQQQTDLLCVAARGRSRLPRFMLGSTAQKILLFSRRPVLVVP